MRLLLSLLCWHKAILLSGRQRIIYCCKVYYILLNNNGKTLESTRKWRIECLNKNVIDKTPKVMQVWADKHTFRPPIINWNKQKQCQSIRNMTENKLFTISKQPLTLRRGSRPIWNLTTNEGKLHTFFTTFYQVNLKFTF